MNTRKHHAAKPLKHIGFDESFKILAIHFFSRFGKVFTDFELINLPKKADVLVVETDEPVTCHVRIFDYFKVFNIIEFKSVNNPFRVAVDLPKILIYTGGLLLNEKKAAIANTTFTLLSSRKPERFLQGYKNDVQKVKNGVYLIEKIVQVPLLRVKNLGIIPRFLTRSTCVGRKPYPECYLTSGIN